MGLGQEQSEGAALSERAGESNFASQQAGDFPRNSQTQPGAAVFAAGTSVGLLKCLEDNLLLLRRNTDAGVADGKGDDRTSMIEHFVFGGPPFGNLSQAEHDLA